MIFICNETKIMKISMQFKSNNALEWSECGENAEMPCVSLVDVTNAQFTPRHNEIFKIPSHILYKHMPSSLALETNGSHHSTAFVQLLQFYMEYNIKSLQSMYVNQCSQLRLSAAKFVVARHCCRRSLYQLEIFHQFIIYYSSLYRLSSPSGLVLIQSLKGTHNEGKKMCIWKRICVQMKTLFNVQSLWMCSRYRFCSRNTIGHRS